MKKAIIVLIAATMLCMSISAQATQSSQISKTSSTSEISAASNDSTVPSKSESTVDVIAIHQTVETEQKNAHKPGEYDDKYYANYDLWCENYEYFTKTYLGEIINPADPSGRRKGINPERTEPWWDEWIAEMLAEGLIEQSWYDDMIEKGYIIEVD